MWLELVTKRGFFRTRWWWRIKASNGETLASSETYSSRMAAMDTLREVEAVANDLGFTVREVTE